MKKKISEIKSQITSYLFVLKIIKETNKRLIPVQIIYGIMSTLFFTVNIYFPKLIVDEVSTTHNYRKVLYIILIMAGSTMVVKTMTMLFEIYQSDNFVKSRDLLKTEIAKIKMTIDYKNMEDPEQLDIQEKALYAVSQFPQLSFNILSGFVGSILKIILSMYFLASLNIGMFLVIILNVFISHWLNIKASRVYHELDKKNSRDRRGRSFLLDLISDFKTGKTIRVYELQEYIIDKIRIFNNNIFQVEREKKRYGSINTCVLQGIDIFQIGFIYLFLTFQYMHGKVTLGDFVIVLNATTQFMMALKDLTRVMVDFDKSVLLVEDYNKFIVQGHGSMEKGISLPKTINSIEFKNVSYRYPNQNVFAVKDLNLRIDSNSKVMLVGENGSGKTTFVKLLLRLYEPSSGEILLNGININRFDKKEYFRLFSTVFQDYKVFAYSIKDNICFGDDSVDDETIRSILRNMDLEERVTDGRNGINTFASTVYSKEGTMFSGGEMQKLALCRALYKNGIIHILDEPTSALDPLSENKIYGRYNEKMEGKIVLYVSHRMSISNKCDFIIVFGNGEIKEQGDHHALMMKEGIYFDMYSKQASLYVI